VIRAILGVVLDDKNGHLIPEFAARNGSDDTGQTQIAAIALRAPVCGRGASCYYTTIVECPVRNTKETTDDLSTIPPRSLYNLSKSSIRVLYKPTQSRGHVRGLAGFLRRFAADFPKTVMRPPWQAESALH
jgi:hypothetical protein